MSKRPSTSHSTTEADNASTTPSDPFGKELREGFDQWNREKPRDAGRQAKDDMPHHRIPRLGDLVARAAHLHEDSSRMSEEAPAGVRRRDAASVAMQQSLIEFDLELVHLMAQRGLGDGKHRGSLGEAAEIGDVHEVI